MQYMRENILSSCAKEDVKFVNLQFTDLHGILKAVTIPVSKLEEALDHNIWFDGSSIEGFTRISESDMYLKADLNTFAIIPWSREEIPTARIICDVFMSDGTPFYGDPRYILKKQIEKAREKGFIFNVGPELEFFLFKKENGTLLTLPFDTAGYFDQASDIASEIRKEMSQMLIDFNINVEALHHEVAPGQHEIDFRYGEALAIADKSITFKYTMKSIASYHDLHATFMPKPLAGINGSGMHVHQSLFNEKGENLFYDPEGLYKLSSLAQSFIAGQLHHIRAISAITNPTVNSYKRLVAGYEAPVYIAWGQKNRSALIRIPRYSPGREKSTRAELRSPDPSANPYLAFAVMLAAGMDGIEKGMKPPEPVEDNIYEFSSEEAEKRGIRTLPNNLYDALKELNENQLIREVLGEKTFKKYCKAKKEEWSSYKTYVSQWEIDKYLEMM